jgi:hypothetical protein
MEEVCECMHIGHSKCVGSKYPKTQVPKRLFHKNPNDLTSQLYKTCSDCREYGAKCAKRRRDALREKSKQVVSDEFQFCPCAFHCIQGVSIYPQSKVPKKFFRRYPEDEKSENVINCYDCRKYNIECSTRKYAVNKEKREEDEKTGKKFLNCPSMHHNTYSNIKKEEVPIHSFRKYPDNPRSPLLDYCSDCREGSSIQHNKNANNIKNNLKDDEFYCGECHKPHPISERAPNLNGTISTTCFRGKELQKQRSLNRAKIIKDVKLEFMEKNQCSCQKCKKVYLIPEENKKYVVEIETYEINDIRYLEYRNVTYSVRDFFQEYLHLIELRILEFDHLTEGEQRERGLLKDDDEFVPKKDSVGRFNCEDSIRLEANKTQILCARCHREETKRLQKNPNNNTGSALRKEKQQYVNNLKRKGCQVCGYSNENLLNFLECDHLDPSTKVEAISEMVMNDKYSLNDVIQETQDTVVRVICRHCHAIHTDEQLKAGIIKTY